MLEHTCLGILIHGVLNCFWVVQLMVNVMQSIVIFGRFQNKMILFSSYQ